MARNTPLSKPAAALRGALLGSEWAAAAEARTELLEIFVNAALARDPDLVDEAGTVFSDASLLVVLAQNLEMEEGPESLAWQLRADAETAILTQELSPSRTAEPNDGTGLVRDDIVVALLRSNSRRMTNQNIVRLVNAAPETVSRALGWLRAQGFVEHWRVGRTAVNQLSDAGISYAQAIVDAHPPRDAQIETAYEEGIEDMQQFSALLALAGAQDHYDLEAAYG